MLEEQLIAEFAKAIRAEAEERISEQDVTGNLATASALTETMVAYLEEAGVVTGHDACPFEELGGRNSCRVIAYSLQDESTTLELLTATSRLDDSTASSKELTKLASSALRFFAACVRGDLDRFMANPAALEAATRIHQQANEIEEVRVHVFTASNVRDRSTTDVEFQKKIAITEIWDIERLYRVRGEEVTRDQIDIDFVKILGRPLSCLEMKPKPAEYETFLTVLPGNLIYDLFEQYGPRLFEFNVRSFLQAKGAVNRGIQRTIKDQPDRFLAYNNGLTATADVIEAGSLNGETVIRRVRGLQIVNGAQTTASIHRAKKVDRLSVDQVAVSMKLTLVPADDLSEFVPLIARYANTQNPIQVADLSASDQFHQQFESLSETVWTPGEESRWFYERARGSYQMARALQGTTPARKREFDRTFPRSQHFGKTDIAKYLMSWWGQPQTVSRGAQKNYATFMFGLRDRLGEGWQPDREFFRQTIVKALLYKASQTSVRRAKLQSYGANVVTYMIALFARKFEATLNFEFIWELQEISSEMHSLFGLWAPEIHKAIVQSAGSRNVTEWCKKDDCWEELKKLELVTPAELPPELVDESVGADEEVSVETADDNSEDELVKLCMALDGAQWMQVMAWIVNNGAIENYDRSVAHTLSGYAINGWIHRPSIKQAIRGARVIRAASAAGAIANVAT
ncbi:AIPR family protein [Lysobacter sp. 2RAF19]